MGWLILRLLASLAGVAAVTFAGYSLVPVNATTEGFAYLLLILLIATFFGFVEASVASFAATLAYNFYFFEPIGELTINDPRNWVALFSFLVTSVIASRLSDKAKQRAFDAVARQQDLERLYSFSRAILLTEPSKPFPKQIAQKISDIFSLSAVVLYDRAKDEFHRAGPAEFEGLDHQLYEAALQGTSFTDSKGSRMITAVRLGADPIAAVALQGSPMPDSVVQGIANLVAIGLERARTQDLASHMEAERQSEALRTTIIHAMAHELKTPLTSIMASTTAFLADGQQSPESKTELVRIADEEARRLKDLIDESLEMAGMDSTNIQVQPEPSNIGEIVREVVDEMRRHIDSRRVDVFVDGLRDDAMLDRRLMTLAIKQLVDNALKYSSPDTPVRIEARKDAAGTTIAVTNHGEEIPGHEQEQIFERWYRSPAVRRRIPGSGLGLSIARDIARAHGGDLSVSSSATETTFRLKLPENKLPEKLVQEKGITT